MENFYKTAIREALDDCADVDLLDLVWKLLLTDEHKPSNDNIITLEVKQDANDPRDTNQHRPVPLRVLRAVEPAKTNLRKVGAGRAELPGVCGGADSLQSAA